MREHRYRRGLTLIELLVVLAIIGVLIALLLPAVMRVRDVGYRAHCMNDLRQIGLAAHQYQGTYGFFPPGLDSDNASNSYPLVSWLTRLLPYVEQDALWRQAQDAYRLDRDPFQNPPHLDLDTVVPLFICPSDSRISSAQMSRGYRVAFTSYLGCSGLDLNSLDGLLYLDSRVRLADVTDGASNTLLAGERPPSTDLYYGWWYAGAGQQFTGSCDMVLGVRELNRDLVTSNFPCPLGPSAFQPGRLSNQCDLFHFWSLHFGGAHFLMVDGSVHFLSYGANSILPALATRAGDEAVELP